MRLFIAIWLPPKIAEKLQEIVAQIKKNFPVPAARFTSPAQWHLTLVFLGRQPVENLVLIKNALKSLPFEKFNVEFEKISYGPVNRPPRMIWLSVTAATSKKLNDLKNLIGEKLSAEKVNWPREKRPFYGHLTLARFSPLNKNSLTPLTLPFSEVFTVDKVSLVQSQLQPKGAIYIELGIFEFRI